MSVTNPVSMVGAQPISYARKKRISVPVPEAAALIYFIYITAAGFVLHLAATEVLVITVLNALTFAVHVALNRNRGRALWLANLADFFPVLLILLAYRESGLFVSPDPAHHLDHTFIRFDRVLLQNRFTQSALTACTPWLQHYLELAYLLCYPLVPLGAAAVQYTWQQHSMKVTDAGSRRAMDEFWTPVLFATLFCYAIYPFFPLTPPRVLFADVPGPHVQLLLRRWNFWLLDHYSVNACIFPSGHVAAATAVALAVRRQARRLGGIFIFLGISVAVATVYGRYHYASDALAGAAVGVAAYIAASHLRVRRSAVKTGK